MKARTQLLSLIWLLFAACVDVSPLWSAPANAAHDAAVSPSADAGDDDGGEADETMRARVAACRTCLATGSCAEGFETCRSDEHCNSFVTCMTDTECWGSPVQDLSNLPPCVIACQSQAQFSSQLDPALVLVFPVANCVNETCANSCLPTAQ